MAIPWMIYQLGEENHPPRQAPPIRLFRERVNDLDKLSVNEFFQNTRLYPFQYRQLHHLLEHHLIPKVPTNNAISSHTKLQSALGFLMSGDNLRGNGRSFGISNSSQSRHLQAVVDAILEEVT